MIEITPTPEQIREAKQTSSGNALQGSITRGAGSPAGALGEILVRDLMGYVHAPTPHYDLYTSQGTRIDVKTKRCTSAPRDYYECSIAAHGTKQDCDEYIFVRVLNNLQRAWILGRISKDEYFEKAVRHRKGEKDDSNNFTFKADCYNLPIRDLWNIEPNYSNSQSTSTKRETSSLT
jgi:hypothetical protein